MADSVLDILGFSPASSWGDGGYVPAPVAPTQAYNPEVSSSYIAPAPIPVYTPDAAAPVYAPAPAPAPAYTGGYNPEVSSSYISYTPPPSYSVPEYYNPNTGGTTSPVAGEAFAAATQTPLTIQNTGAANLATFDQSFLRQMFGSDMRFGGSVDQNGWPTNDPIMSLPEQLRYDLMGRADPRYQQALLNYQNTESRLDDIIAANPGLLGQLNLRAIDGTSPDAAWFKNPEAYWAAQLGANPATAGLLTPEQQQVGAQWRSDMSAGAQSQRNDPQDGMLGTLLSIASLIPSPIQPFAQAANAAYAASQGNWATAILSGLGANASFSGVDASVLADARQLAGQGMSMGQISDIIGQTYGVNAAASLTAAAGGSLSNAIGGVFNSSTGTITTPTGSEISLGDLGADTADDVSDALTGGGPGTSLGITDWNQLSGQSVMNNPNGLSWNNLTGGSTIGDLGTGTFGTTFGPDGLFGLNIGGLTGLSPEVVAALGAQGINLTGRPWVTPEVPIPGIQPTSPAGAGTNVVNTPGVGGVSGGATGGTSGTGSWLGGVLGGLTGTNPATGSALGSLLGGGATLLGGYLNSQNSQQAAQSQSDAIIRAAQIAADAAKFRPVGVSTRFGTSKFIFDPVTGYLKTAGYDLAPDVAAQREQLMGMAPGMLNQFQQSVEKTAPMGTAAARMMELGNNYLLSTPEQQAAKYMAEQQALLNPGNQAEYAKLQNTLRQQGRLGLSVGGEDGMMATNPEFAAYQNKLEMQQRQLAANATAAGQQYATFGAGLVGSGGDMFKNMYSTQTAAYAPYQTTMGGAQYLEGLGQNAMTQGISLGSTATAANAAAGSLLASGMTNAANIVGNNAQQTGSTWGNLLSGAGKLVTNLSKPQQAFQYDSETGLLKLV